MAISQEEEKNTTPVNAAQMTMDSLPFIHISEARVHDEQSDVVTPSLTIKHSVTDTANPNDAKCEKGMRMRAYKQFLKMQNQALETRNTLTLENAIPNLLFNKIPQLFE